MKGSRRATRMDVWAGMDVRDFVSEYGGAGFNAKHLSDAVDIYKEMLKDKKCVKVLTAAGALIAGGMRNVFVKFIRAGMVDVFIATGGSILTHDLIEAFGVHHMQGSAITDDVKLAEKGTVRIYDVFLRKNGYVVLEDELQKIFPKLPQKEMSPKEFLAELGKHIKDKNSIIRACSDMGVPIFCPSFTDSILGFQAWMYSQTKQLKINSQLDIRDIMDIVWENERFGALILGGGVPKHFIAGMMQVSGKELNYAVQITLDRPEHGGVSGAHLQEAKSWKKIAADALVTDVISDVTIAFPLIVAALLKSKDEKLESFHGHLGPYVIIGKRMGMIAKKHLGNRIKAEVFTGTKPSLSCIIDGIQFSTNCTLGKGNLTVINKKIPVARFTDGKKTLTIKLRKGLKIEIAEDVYKLKDKELFEVR